MSSVSNENEEGKKNDVIRTDKPRIIFIEPFYGGSHKALLDVFIKYFCEYTLVTLPAKKWHWKARCGALFLENIIPEVSSERVLFCSSVLNLAELLGLRNDLCKLRKVVYFHENQLVYPVREIKQRDVQYAYNQLTTCLSADVVVFNSDYNRKSFLNNIKSVSKIIPHKLNGLQERIQRKSLVLYFPVQFPKNISNVRSIECLHIVWPHRWEFDKGPDEFFEVIRKMKANGLKFKLSVLGESFTDVPDIFHVAKNEFRDEILHFGYLDSKEDYYRVLTLSHVVVSTAKHEFFGVSMLEATFCGCFPLLPNSLVYPEIYPQVCLYEDLGDLYQRLAFLSESPDLVVEQRQGLFIDFTKYDCDILLPKYAEIMQN